MSEHVESSPQRLPRFARHRFRKPRLSLQERDREIVRLAAAYRFLVSADIQALVPGSPQQVLRRLQKLYHGGYLDRPRHQLHLGNTKMVYALGQRGAQLLAADPALAPLASRDWAEQNRQVKAGFLSHALMVSRFRAVLTLATRARPDVVLEKWEEEKALQDAVVVEHQDWTERIPVCPDGYFVLKLANEPEGRNRVHVFVEADRGTMTLGRVETKLRGYWHYWQSGQHTERFGMTNFIVLTIALTTERATNLCQTAAQLDAPEHRGLRMFLFGSMNDVTLEEPCRVLDSVWMTAEDGSRHSLLE